MGKAKQLAQRAVWGSFAVAGLGLVAMAPVMHTFSRSLPLAERAILLSPLLLGIGINFWNEVRLERLLKAGEVGEAELAEAQAWVRQPWLTVPGWVLVVGAFLSFLWSHSGSTVLLFAPQAVLSRLAFKLQPKVSERFGGRQTWGRIRSEHWGKRAQGN